jgi:hypothetical protein
MLGKFETKDARRIAGHAIDKVLSEAKKPT